MIHSSVSDQYHIVIGIDFGTTRSGFNYSYTNFLDVQNVQRWEGDENRVPYAKTVTEIAYHKENDEYLWGYPAKDADEDIYNIYKLFKLSLPQKNEPPFFPLSEDGNKKKDSLHLVKVIADYLLGLKEYALTYLTLPNALISLDEILWCISIPAMWSHVEKKRMREAAIEAGLVSKSDPNRLLLVYEPEAAAIYCQHLLGNKQNLLFDGDRFMVIDAGGGTIDITSYEVINSQLKELVSTNGDMCGSTFVDREFFKYFLGLEVFNIDKLSALFTKSPKIFNELLENWEMLKCDPNLFKTEKINFRFPTSFYEYLIDESPESLELLKSIQNGKRTELFISKNDLEGIFAPVIGRIMFTIDKHLDKIPTRHNGKKCDYIFLVGGFSKSEYLRKSIEEKFYPVVGEKSNILRPHNPEQAIVAGATYYGLNPYIIRSRISVLTYGISSNLPFESGIDPENRKIYNKYKDMYYCNSRFSVFVRAEQSIEANQVVSHTYVPMEPNQTSMRISIYSTYLHNPRYSDEEHVILVGEMTIPMPNTEKGVDRPVLVEMYFGETEIRVTATDETTGIKDTIPVIFTSTFVPKELRI